MATEKIQKNFQLTAEVAEWLEGEAEDTGLSYSRLAVAALLAWKTRSESERRVLIKLATRVDKGSDTWRGVAVELVTVSGEVQLRATPSSPIPDDSHHGDVRKARNAKKKR